MVRARLAISVVLVSTLLLLNTEAKSDPYKVSQKSLSRRQTSTMGLQDAVSYSLLDAAKQFSFLRSLDKSEFRTSNKHLIAYKPRRGKFATFKGNMTMEEVERFVAAVLNGDIQFTKTRQKPEIK